jgi:arginyl-tRNA synthetase
MKSFADIQIDIARVIADNFPEIDGDAIAFQQTPPNQPGDIGMACFPFAKALRTSPVEIAGRIAALTFPDGVKQAQAIGPYVNFTFDRDGMVRGLLAGISAQGDSYGSTGEGAGKNVLLEHTSINPNASPHIGRSRNGLIGDVLARLLRFEGYDVDVHYYVNDMGKQIGLLALEVEGKDELNFDDVLDEYVAANQHAKDDPAFEQAGLELLMKMEQGDPEVRETFTRLVDICLNGQLGVLERLGLTYDTFDRESTFLTDPRMDAVMGMLKDRGALFIDADNRTVVDLSHIGWESEEGRYLVLIRGNGSSMYVYRDIAYTLEKIERAEGHNYIVLGEDHKMYFEQLALIVTAMGKIPPKPVFYSYILLKEGKMSTRKGTVVLLSDFLDEAIAKSREKVDEQWADQPEDERAEIARIIGIGSVRFAILSVRPNRNVVFDWETALSFTGDSGPYIQYSCTRIASILRKFGAEIADVPDSITVTHDAEWLMALRLARVPDDIAAALEARNTGIITTTALDVARTFSRFYTDCPVLSAEDAAVRDTRLALCVAVQQVLMNLLWLLGIETPERM